MVALRGASTVQQRQFRQNDHHPSWCQYLLFRPLCVAHQHFDLAACNQIEAIACITLPEDDLTLVHILGVKASVKWWQGSPHPARRRGPSGVNNRGVQWPCGRRR